MQCFHHIKQHQANRKKVNVRNTSLTQAHTLLSIASLKTKSRQYLCERLSASNLKFKGTVRDCTHSSHQNQATLKYHNFMVYPKSTRTFTGVGAILRPVRVVCSKNHKKSPERAMFFLNVPADAEKISLPRGIFLRGQKVQVAM